MKYTQDQFFRLMDLVERQGGVHLDSAHDPIVIVNWTGSQLKSQKIVYCGNDTLFSVPYFAAAKQKGVHREKESVILCAVCDHMGAMPRFAEVME